MAAAAGHDPFGRTISVVIVSLPGFFIYAGLIRMALAQPPWPDPYAIWIGSIVINTVWLVVLGAAPAPTPTRLVLGIAALVSGCCSVIGFRAAVKFRPT
jgi:hypothetical protein